MLANLASVVLSVAILLLAVPQASAQPVPPCPDNKTDTTPAYGGLGEAPIVQVWQDLELNDPAG